jgi:hypothetical protein
MVQITPINEIRMYVYKVVYFENPIKIWFHGTMWRICH